MKILIINGSPHRGNTWRLTEKVKLQIETLDNTVKFEEIHLSELNIPFCTGCSLCFRKGHVFWKKYVGMPYAPGVPLPTHKRVIGRIIYHIGKYLSPRMIVTYKK